MMLLKFGLVIVFVSGIPEVLLLSHPNNNKEEGGEFCYIQNDLDCGPSSWTGECNTGERQSPININYKGSLVGWKTTHLEFNGPYYRKHNFITRNTGESFMIQLNGMEPLMIDCGALDGSYTFAQLHFHWGQRNDEGSEHTLENRRFPLEMHVVHYKTRYGSFENAMNEDDPEAIAVFAIFFHLGASNPSLGPIIQAAMAPDSLNEQEDFSPQSRTLNIRGLLPDNMDFVRYLGSLTTPPCTQKVIWTVFVNPVPISETQLSAFRRLHNVDGETYFNFRPTQPLNGRQLTYYRIQNRKSISKKVDTVFSFFEMLKHILNEILHAFDDFIHGFGVNKGVILLNKDMSGPHTGLQSWFNNAVMLRPLHVLFQK